MTTQASKPTTTPSTMPSTTPSTKRSEYPLIVCVMSRWNDYDMLGHVNNVEYYRYFETAILTLLRETGLDWQTDPVIPLAAENGCRFLKPVGATDSVDVGVRIAHLGKSSVRYEVAIFVADESEAYATGFFIHVFIDRQRGRSVEMPLKVRDHFMAEQAAGQEGAVRHVAEARLLPAPSRV